MICGQFGYIYWIKEARDIAKTMYYIVAVNFIFLIYYIYAGSPDNSAKILDDFINNITT